MLFADFPPQFTFLMVSVGCVIVTLFLSTIVAYVVVLLIAMPTNMPESSVKVVFALLFGVMFGVLSVLTVVFYLAPLYERLLK